MMVIPVVVIIVVAAILVMIVTAIANRPQEVIEGLSRDASPLPPPRRVREAEMNPHVDSSVDHVVGQIEKRWYVRSFGMACGAVVVTVNVTLSVSKKRATMVVKEPARPLAPDV